MGNGSYQESQVEHEHRLLGLELRISLSQLYTPAPNGSPKISTDKLTEALLMKSVYL